MHHQGRPGTSSSRPMTANNYRPTTAGGQQQQPYPLEEEDEYEDEDEDEGMFSFAPPPAGEPAPPLQPSPPTISTQFVTPQQMGLGGQPGIVPPGGGLPRHSVAPGVAVALPGQAYPDYAASGRNGPSFLQQQHPLQYPHSAYTYLSPPNDPRYPSQMDVSEVDPLDVPSPPYTQEAAQTPRPDVPSTPSMISRDQSHGAFHPSDPSQRGGQPSSGSTLTPAAAYALASQNGSSTMTTTTGYYQNNDGPGTPDGSPGTHTIDISAVVGGEQQEQSGSTARRRGGFHYPESPTYPIPDPYNTYQQQNSPPGSESYRDHGLRYPPSANLAGGGKIVKGSGATGQGAPIVELEERLRSARAAAVQREKNRNPNQNQNQGRGGMYGGPRESEESGSSAEYWTGRSTDGMLKRRSTKKSGDYGNEVAVLNSSEGRGGRLGGSPGTPPPPGTPPDDVYGTRDGSMMMKDLSPPGGGERRIIIDPRTGQPIGKIDMDNLDIDLVHDFGEELGMGMALGGIEEEDSPYPEVRASVSNIDDPEMPCLTFRVWFLGILFTIVCSALNLYFILRYPSPLVTPIIVQVLAFPAGKFLAWALPTRGMRLKLPIWLVRLCAGPQASGEVEISLNPGPFNIKEHTVVVIMANAAIAPAYATNLTLVLDKYYDTPKGIGFDMLTILCTQLIGFGMAGVCRRFLVWPASMIWPQNLVFCTLLNTFHAEEDQAQDGRMTRFKFFGIVATCAFFWYFLPGYLFTALSTFSWVCWIWPQTVVVNQLFGVVSGLGMSFLTFDWSNIVYITSPLIVPWWAICNIMVGFVFFYWILVPILYYSNVWDYAYMPILSSQVYDRYGQVYNVTRVIQNSFNFNSTAYEEYSPVYIPSTYSIVYAISFALATSAITHTALYHGRSIIDKIKNVKTEAEDVHAKLMRNYPEVPDWWYWIYLIIFVALAIVSITVFGGGMPVWGLLLALLLTAVYILPAGFIYAMTAQQMTINTLTEMIPGYLMEGNAIANMIFKCYSIQSLIVGLSFVQDLKLGHYMKIPPRATFTVQIVAATISAFVQCGMKEFLVATVPDLCNEHQKDLLTCPQNAVFYTSSIIWGLIGPARQFGPGTLYNPQLWWLLIGAAVPFVFYLAARRWPNSWAKFVNIPVMLTGCSFIPPAAGINYSSWFLMAVIFQYWLRRRHFHTWTRYSFLLSAGLDSGTILSAILIFFILQLPDHGNISVNWIGNNIYKQPLDWTGVAYKTLPPGQSFGASTWVT